MKRVLFSVFKSILVILFFASNGVAQQQWRVLDSGVDVDLYAIQFLDAEIGYVCGDKGTVLKSTDAGSTWTTLALTSTFPVRALCFISTNEGWVVTGDVDDSDVSGQIWKTSDGGNTWVQQEFSSTRARLGISFVSSTVGWACGARNGPLDIEATTDGGATYNSQSSASIFGWTYGIKAVSVDTIWSIGGTYFPALSGFILYSTNGGNQWRQRATGNIPFLYALDFVDDLTGFTVGEQGAVYATTDAGGTWVPRSTGIVNVLRSVSFSDPMHGLVCGDGGSILRTSDGGEQWLDESLSTGIDLNGIFALDADRAWAVGNNGSILRFDNATHIAGEAVADDFSVIVYPVPAEGSVMFYFEADALDMNMITVRVCNTNGVEVLRVEELASSQLVIDRRNIGHGVFIYDVLRGGERLHSGKFIMLK